MNAIRFRCPGCGREFEVPADQAGRRGACTHCRSRFTIPVESASLVPPPPRPVAALPLARSNVPASGNVPAPVAVAVFKLLIGGFALLLVVLCFFAAVGPGSRERGEPVRKGPAGPRLASTSPEGWEMWSIPRTVGAPVHARVFKPKGDIRPRAAVAVLGDIDTDVLRRTADLGFLVLAPVEPESEREIPSLLRRMELKSQELHVVGLDWYCWPAWEFAAMNPDWVRSLRLVDPRSVLPHPSPADGTEIPVHLHVMPAVSFELPQVGRRYWRMKVTGIVVRPEGSTDWVNALAAQVPE